MPRLRRWTDEQLRDAVAVSENLNQVCKLLDITPGARTYDLLRRHMKRIGIDSSHLPTVERPRRRRTWTDDDLREAVANSRSTSAVLRTFGYDPSGGMHRYIKRAIQELELDTSHFVGQGWNKGQAHKGGSRRPLAEILVTNSSYGCSSTLRQRLIAEGLKPAYCERCGRDSWFDEPLPLHLDHINGDHSDNRIENLRILCPNCHALTPTWCGRNRSKMRNAGVSQRQRNRS